MLYKRAARTRRAPRKRHSRVINGVGDETGELMLRVHGDVTRPSTWADLVDGCTRAWIRQFNPMVAVKRVPLWARLKVVTMAALVGVVSVVGTFGIIDAGRREPGPSSLSTGRIAVGWW